MGRFRVERALYTKALLQEGGQRIEKMPGERPVWGGGLKPLKGGVGHRWNWTCSQGQDQVLDCSFSIIKSMDTA